MSLSPEQKRLAEENIGLVHACARRFTGRGVSYEDLVGAGSVGLVKAAEGFDPDLGFCFSTYAVPSILGEMKRLFRDGGAVKIGRAAKEKAASLLRLSDEMEQKEGVAPTVARLAEAVGIPVPDAAALLGACLPPVSLTAEEGGDFDLPAPSGEEDLISGLDLQSALSRLPEREASLLHLRYEDALTQSEAGKRLGLTQVQVSRLEKRVLLKLRTWLE